MEIQRGLGTQWVRARGRPVGSAEALPEEWFHEAVTVGTAGDGGGPGNVTLNPFASALLRGLLAVGESGQCGGGPQPGLGYQPGVRRPQECSLSGDLFSHRGIGKPWTSSLFPFSPAQPALVPDLEKHKRHTEVQNVCG